MIVAPGGPALSASAVWERSANKIAEIEDSLSEVVDTCGDMLQERPDVVAYIGYMVLFLRYISGEVLTGEQYILLQNSEVTNFLSGHWLSGRLEMNPEQPVAWTFEQDQLNYNVSSSVRILDACHSASLGQPGAWEQLRIPGVEDWGEGARPALDAGTEAIQVGWTEAVDRFASSTWRRIARKLALIQRNLGLLRGRVEFLGPRAERVSAELDLIDLALRYLAEEPVGAAEYDDLDSSGFIRSLGGIGIEAIAESDPQAMVHWSFEEDTIDAWLALTGGYLSELGRYERAVARLQQAYLARRYRPGGRLSIGARRTYYQHGQGPAGAGGALLPPGEEVPEEEWEPVVEGEGEKEL